MTDPNNPNEAPNQPSSSALPWEAPLYEEIGIDKTAGGHLNYLEISGSLGMLS